MPVLLVVEKGGSIKEITVKDVNEEELYKKAGFKTKEGFVHQNSWLFKKDNMRCAVCLYGKTKGRAGMENKYDFPPPVDSVLYFGSCILLARNDKSEVTDLTKPEWLKIYEKLFGGFEDLGSEDSEEEEEEEEEDVPRTKEGYVKDDFVVDDDDEEEEEEEDDDETELLDNDEDETSEDDVEDDMEDDLDDDEEEEEDDEEEEDEEEDHEMLTSKKKTALKKKPEIKKKMPAVEKPPKKIAERSKRGQEGLARTESNNYLNCSNELAEEEYI